jgi:FOG: Ankyrin repeat
MNAHIISDLKGSCFCRYLLQNRADPLIRDAEQNIALHWSAFSGSVDISEMLLDFGCDVNSTNVHGDTPL